MALALNRTSGPSWSNGTPQQRAAIVFKWLGRLAALGLLFVWGAFFVEHVHEWYIKPRGAYPPVWVFVTMLAHLTILIGLGVSLRWSLAGAAITLVATLGFFAILFLHGKVPDVMVMLVNLVPIACFAAWWGLTRTSSSRPAR